MYADLVLKTAIKSPEITELLLQAGTRWSRCHGNRSTCRSLCGSVKLLCHDSTLQHNRALYSHDHQCYRLELLRLLDYH